MSEIAIVMLAWMSSCIKIHDMLAAAIFGAINLTDEHQICPLTTKEHLRKWYCIECYGTLWWFRHEVSPTNML